MEKNNRVDKSEILTLEGIRHSLIRQEDSIIFGLLERAQYCYNADAYERNIFLPGGSQGSLVEFMLRETEKLHAQAIFNSAAYDDYSTVILIFLDWDLPILSSFVIQVGRYKSPDEHPFFPNDLPEPLLPPMQYPQVIFLGLLNWISISCWLNPFFS